MKSLQRVQKIMSVLKVLAKVVFVFSIVGASLSLLMTLIIVSLGSESQIVEEVIKQYEASGILPQGTDIKEFYQLMMATMMSSTLLCISEAIIYYFVKDMYNYAVEIGTPFDKTLVMKMRKVGKLRIIVSIITLIICAIIISIMSKSSDQISLSNSSSIVIGILYLIIACFLDYGSDINHLPNNDEVVNENNADNSQNNENN
ncbi:MAG: hypothetical protein SOU19_06955 [Candidatus Caccosoma sp.]|nr:hypothetical protein [Candidatus Caccosoma sp.]